MVFCLYWVVLLLLFVQNSSKPEHLRTASLPHNAVSPSLGRASWCLAATLFRRSARRSDLLLKVAASNWRGLNSSYVSDSHPSASWLKCECHSTS